MSLTLIFKSIRIIKESSLSVNDKEDLLSSVRVALHWTQEQKDLFDSAVMNWVEIIPSSKNFTVRSGNLGK